MDRNFNTKTKNQYLEDLFNDALKNHRTGDLIKACKSYQKLYKIAPRNSALLALYGAAASQMENNNFALKLLSKAIENKSLTSDTFNNRGVVLKRLGMSEEALSDFNQALSIDPNNAFALNNTGQILKERGDLNQALKYFNLAISLNDDYADAYNNRGKALFLQGKVEDALMNYKKAILLKPDDESSYYNLGTALTKLKHFVHGIKAFDRAIELKIDYIEAYNNRGLAFFESQKFDEALVNFDKAISLDSKYADALNNRGITYRELGRFDEALVDFDKAISLDSSYTAEVSTNRSIVYRELGRFDEAIKDLNKAISLKPDFEKAYNNRGNIQKDLQHYDLAMEDFNRAIQLDPEYVDAYWNKALCMLHLGDFKSGWPLYEWRWKRDKSISGEPITTTKPMWSGESDKTIFLWSEQGVGDEIMFASLVPELQQTSMHVILHCDKRLVPLFKRSFMGNISFCNDRDTVDENSYDFHIPMGSLPLILRPTLSSFKKGSQAYLKCQQSKADALKSTLLGKQKEILVGISWLSKSKIPGAIQRNVDLAEIAQHLNKPNIKLVNLQYGDVSGEIKSLKDNQNIDVIQVEEIDNKNDIDGLAALIMACDHIVTIDNATVHLASALGAKTKLLLPINHEWRWGLEPKTSYWYDSLELYRQKQLNDWETNLKSISSEIQSKHN
jgi:tetratricopeptide (TPR) repeat protein